RDDSVDRLELRQYRERSGRGLGASEEHRIGPQSKQLRDSFPSAALGDLMTVGAEPSTNLSAYALVSLNYDHTVHPTPPNSVPLDVARIDALIDPSSRFARDVLGVAGGT